MSTRSLLRLTPILFPLLLAGNALAQITPGNLIVTRVGDGLGLLSSAATAVFLDEYTAGGTYVQTIALPTAPSGGNRAVTNSGSATSEGFVSQSADGRYLITVGYDAAPGTAAVAGLPALTVNRVIARIGLDGTIDSSTALTDAHSSGNIRSAASFDGNQFWTAGSNQSSRYVAALGATTSTVVGTGLTNLRVVNIFDGQLYTSSASGTFQGVSAVGTGLPTTAGQTITLLPGFPTAAGPSAYDYFFADASTLYVADDRNTALGGIQKWQLVAGTWTLQYTLQAAPSTGCRGIAGTVDGGVVTLYATTSTPVTQLVHVVDTGAGAPFTVLATSVGPTAIRGVQFVRWPSSQTPSGSGCATSIGIPTLATAGGLPQTGNLAFQFQVGGMPAGSFAFFLLGTIPVLPIGIPIPGAPPCALLFVVPDVLPVGPEIGGTCVMPLPIPNNSVFGGIQLAVQGAVFDFALLPSFGLPVGTTDALQLVIGN